MSKENMLAEALDLLVSEAGYNHGWRDPSDVSDIITKTFNKHHIHNTLEAKSRMRTAITVLENLRVVDLMPDGCFLLNAERMRQLLDLMAAWRAEGVVLRVEAEPSPRQSRKERRRKKRRQRDLEKSADMRISEDYRLLEYEGPPVETFKDEEDE